MTTEAEPRRGGMSIGAQTKKERELRRSGMYIQDAYHPVNRPAPKDARLRRSPVFVADRIHREKPAP